MEENLWWPARAKFSLLLSSVWLVWKKNVLAVLKIIIYYYYYYYYLSSSGICYDDDDEICGGVRQDMLPHMMCC